MILKAIFAYLHYISFITMICTVVIENVLFRQTMSSKNASIIQKTDSVYGLSAILVIATGTVRFFYLEKGYEYYLSNYLFITKLILVLIVGLLSIYPTIVFIKWRKEVDDRSELHMEAHKYTKIKRMLRAEIILLILVPLLAALASRGIGFEG